MRRARIAVALTAAVTGVVLGTGCSGDAAEPQTLPTHIRSSPAPTPSSTTQPTTQPAGPASPDEPVIPDAARAPGRAGAEAFVRYYIDLLNYAGLTGDVAAFSDVARRCSSCANLARDFEEAYRNGGYYKTKGWRVNTVFAGPGPGQHYVTVVEVRQMPIEWRTRAGGPVHRLPESQISLRFSVARKGSTWLITELTRS